MQVQPLVSIIIPTFNRAHLIGETLDSVLAQTYQNWECIVVDDGSTDGTDVLMGEYVAKDSRFQYHHRPKDRLPGGNAARNYGFEVSKGEFVNWFDDDDIMLPNFLSEKALFFKDEINMIICSGSYINSHLEKVEHINLSLESTIFKDYCLWNLQILTPSILFKKQFLANKELFNLKLTRGQEAEFFSRLFFNSEIEDYIIINKQLFYYRQHELFKYHDYNSNNEYSRIYVDLINLRRSIKIEDSELIKYFYKKLINSFFKSKKNKSVTNSNFLHSELQKIIVNKYLRIKLSILNLLLNLNIKNTRVKEYFLSQNITSLIK